MTLLEHLLSGKDQSVANSAAYLVGRTRLRQIRLNREGNTSSEFNNTVVYIFRLVRHTITDLFLTVGCP